MKQLEEMNYEELIEAEKKIRELKKKTKPLKYEPTFECVDIYKSRLENIVDLEDYERRQAIRSLHTNLKTIVDIAVGNYELRRRLNCKKGKHILNVQRNKLVSEETIDVYESMRKELDELVKKYMENEKVVNELNKKEKEWALPSAEASWKETEEDYMMDLMHCYG